MEYETLVRLLKSCKDLPAARKLHAFISSGEHRDHLVLANLTVEMYGRCSNVHDAKKAFDDIPCPNSFSLAALMLAYSRNGHWYHARDVFDVMLDKSYVLWNALLNVYARNGDLDDARRIFWLIPSWSVVTWSAMLAALNRKELFEEAKQCFDMMPERNVVGWTSMITANAKRRYILEARRIFEKMPQRDVVSWTEMVDTYAQHGGDVVEARELFESMPARDGVSWSAMVQGYAGNGGVDQAKAMLDRIPAFTVIAANAVMHCLAQRGNQLGEAVEIFHQMPIKSAVSWNILMAGFIQRGDVDRAKALFDQMPGREIVAWSMLIAGYSQAGNLAMAKKFFDRVPQRNQFSWSSIIAAYAQLGHLDVALDTFRSVPCPDLHCWTAIVVAFAQNGQGDAAIELFQAMVLEGIALDSVAFLAILSACGHAGMLAHAFYFLDWIGSDHGIAASKSHVSCVIAMLGRAGQLREAEDLMVDAKNVQVSIPSSKSSGKNAVVGTMPGVEDFLPGWMALLGSSRFHSKIDLGFRAAAEVAGLDASKGAAYILLNGMLMQQRVR